MSRKGDIKVLMRTFKIDEEQATTMLDKNAVNINFIKNGLLPTLDARFTTIKGEFEKDLQSIMDEFELDMKKED
jgi:hypothetical protein